MPATTVIIPAAGRGRRFGVTGLPKQFQLLDGRPVLWHTLRRFADHPAIDSIVVAIHPDDAGAFAAMAGDFDKVATPVHGGAERADSVRLAMESLAPGQGDDLVLVHDAVRPWVSDRLIDDVIAATARHGAAIPVMPVTETVKVVEGDLVLDSPTRSRLYNAQTPQGFGRKVLLAALAAKTDMGQEPPTDEAALVAGAGFAVHVVAGEATNVKITTTNDLKANDPTTGGAVELRVGSGYDVHALTRDRPLILGGVRIDFDMGLAGHSDADVLTHAVIDALLGAAGMGDIGRLFPDTDQAFAGINSLRLLESVRDRLAVGGMVVINVDAVIMAQAPKLAPHVDTMSTNMAEVLGISADRVSVKATTTERLGFVGRQEGMAAQATVLLQVPRAPGQG